MNALIRERKDLFALIAWIQTFPEFTITLYNGSETDNDYEQLLHHLSTSETASDVSKVTEILCGASVDSMLALIPLDTEGISSVGSNRSGTDLIWNSMYTLTTSKARPFKVERNYSNEKVLILSNLLDCAVQAPDKQLRRTYIGRIMTLKKSAQKTIMAIIESRSSSNQTPKSATSSIQSQSPILHSFSSKSLGSITQQSRTSVNSNSSPATTAKTTSTGLFASPSPFKVTKEKTEAVLSSMICASATNVNSTTLEPLTPCPINTPDHKGTPLKSSMKKSSDGNLPSSRGLSVAFGSTVEASTPNTPITSNQKFVHEKGTLNEVGFLSPGTLESPSRMQSIVLHLQSQNTLLQQKLNKSHKEEAELRLKIDDMEVAQRKKMMSLEAQSISRNQDLVQEYEARITTLQEQLLEEKEVAAQGSIAIRELKKTKDELEIVNHSKLALAETTEKLRKYKEKITELQDVKEALQKEQEAHAKSVNELIQLENEFQQLQPVKRQVEDYRIRAIEAEVKLVECQDYLRRMERVCKDQSVKNDNLYNDIVMQKEHMDELQQRIQEDTKRAMETPISISGIGVGISELNPELKEEMIRLRNENLQLRAFQSKRTEDAVQHLEKSLDDTKRLADRYKNEFLRVKEDLGSTSTALQNSEQREANLQGDIQQLQLRYDDLEQRNQSLQGQLDLTQQQLNSTQKIVEDIEQKNTVLQTDLNMWIQKYKETDKVFTEQSHRLQETRDELEQTAQRLLLSQDAAENLRKEVKQINDMVIESENQRQHLKNVLERTNWELEDLRKKCSEKIDEIDVLQSQISKLQRDNCTLEEAVRVERVQRKEDHDEAQKSLESTREVLEAKSKKDLDELRANMATLLDHERKANRKKDEDSKRNISELEEQWSQKYAELQDRTTSAVQSSRQQAQEQVDFIKAENEKEIAKLKQEWEDDVAKLKKESSETLDNFIRKGKEKVKVMQAKVYEEMQRLEDERRDIEEKYELFESQSTEKEIVLNEQIHNLNQQLAFTTSQMNDFRKESDEYLERIKALDREKFKLHQENDQYRRQLGSRYGSEGQVQSQLEKLQKEYNVVVEENRNLKKQQIQTDSMSDPTIKSADEGGNRPYRRGGGVDRRAITQMQKEYEERIDSLNNEKRDLIMKMSSQSTDVHRAEKRAWEAEETITKLKEENTSLQLRLRRAEVSAGDRLDNDSINENQSPMESSFHSSYQVVMNPSPAITDSPGKAMSRSSPGIDRAKKHKMEQESKLRSRFSSITRTPSSSSGHHFIPGLTISSSASTVPINDKRQLDEVEVGTDVPVLPRRSSSPIDRSQSVPSPKTPSRISKMASDVFRLGLHSNNAASNNGTSSAGTLSKDTPDNMPLGSLHMHNTQAHIALPPPSTSNTNEHLDSNNQECRQS